MTTYYQCLILNASRDFDSPYTYKSQSRLSVGQIVEVPFGKGNSTRQAVIQELLASKPDFETKEILRVHSPEALLNNEHFFLAKEMRRRYFVSQGRAIAAMLPKIIWSMRQRMGLFARIADIEEAIYLLEEGGLRSRGQERVLEFLLGEQALPLEDIRQSCDVSQAVVKALEKKGLIEFFKQEIEYEDTSFVPDFAASDVSVLNAEQEVALNEIRRYLAANQESEFLLHGVTASGKTEVYLRAAKACLDVGKTVLILVPEISLTPLLEARVAERFGEDSAILHSRLGARQRFENWRKIKNGEKRVVIGARSAIFAPLENIGLIVIDEEQESSYKSELTPRYDAHELARIRAHYNQACLLLSSATPSVSTYHRTETGRAELLDLPNRAIASSLPRVNLIDLKKWTIKEPGLVLAKPLKEAMSEAFSRGEQVLLFLNRRGHQHSMICGDCGELLLCPHCDIALTLHQSRNYQARLICHYCSEIYPADTVCPHCNSTKIEAKGIGTQALEMWLEEQFPDERCLRLDQDTSYSKEAYGRILSAFAKGEASCLLGTQMIAKGHDFPKVTVAGVVSADQLLAQPDFRAAERCFQLLTQVAGRAGRAELPGQVFVQSYNLDHYAIESGLAQDYEAFYRTELELRRKFNYPPFGHIATIIYSSPYEQDARDYAAAAAASLAQVIEKESLSSRVQLFPAQVAPLAKLKSRFRYRIILKSQDKELLTKLLHWEQSHRLPSGLLRVVDIDPGSLA